MEELKESIKKHGIIQPIIVRKMANGYEELPGAEAEGRQRDRVKEDTSNIKNFNNEKSFRNCLGGKYSRERLIR